MGIIEAIRRKNRERHNKMVKEIAQSKYQITEFDGEMWFTYDGVLCMPCSTFSGTDPIKILEKLRSEYIAHNSK